MNCPDCGEDLVQDYEDVGVCNVPIGQPYCPECYYEMPVYPFAILDGDYTEPGEAS